MSTLTVRTVLAAGAVAVSLLLLNSVALLARAYDARVDRTVARRAPLSASAVAVKGSWRSLRDDLHMPLG
jgi:hypothetical protein